ncbi:hypothetical protein [Lentzea sp. E54]|uniref:hypothetical protein n=1 Tax=Lentzea xerophila TaxID=3435883 RepID=UPI003DA49EF7
MSQPQSRFAPVTFADLGAAANITMNSAVPLLLRIGGAVVDYFGGAKLSFPTVELGDGTLHPGIMSAEEIDAARSAAPDVYSCQFVMSSRYTFSGYLPLASGQVVRFRPDGRISSSIPVELSFERPRGANAVMNLRVRRGAQPPQLAYGTEVRLVVEVAVGRDAEPGSAYAEITFDWTETSRTSITQPLARLRVYGNGKVVADDNFRFAVGGEQTAEVIDGLSGQAHLNRVREQLLAEFLDLGGGVDLT